MPERLSYRLKVPLNICLVVLATVAIITLTLLGYNYRMIDREMLQSGESLGRVLAKGVSQPMLRDDVWTVWDTIRTPMEVSLDDAIRPEAVTVTDERGRVFASTAPRTFRVLALPAEVDPRYRALDPWPDSADPPSASHVWMDDDSVLVAVPVLVDGSIVGSVLLEYRRPGFYSRFAGALQQVMVTTVIILLVMLPVGWWLGRRVARPLLELAGVMDRIGDESPGTLQSTLPNPIGVEAAGGDEIIRLRSRFREMLGQLADKEALEQEMVRSDRLAAVGRLSAGIAHEINNPVGGMLNALSTQRRHGQVDAVTDRTLSLLERGLEQIRTIVAALLVEARFQSHDLGSDDLEDIATLIQGECRERRVSLEWKLQLSETVHLPATPVRQVLMNLLLNAIRAAGDGGRVQCGGALRGRELDLFVCNDGKHIPRDDMDHLFEPFFVGDDERKGTGLGLWVSYQIVQQLGGRIDVESRPGRTCFSVRLPLPAVSNVE